MNNRCPQEVGLIFAEMCVCKVYCLNGPLWLEWAGGGAGLDPPALSNS